jgi:hypothetical protein
MYRDTQDHLVDIHDKLLTRVYNQAQAELDEHTKKQRQMMQTSLATFQSLGTVILDESVVDSQLREVLFQQIGKEDLATQVKAVETWLNGKYSHVFHLVVQRFNYLRQFTPTLLEHMQFRLEEGNTSKLVEAIELLKGLNQENKRKLPEDVPVDFIPKSLRRLVEVDGEVDKHAWECALFTVLRDEIRAGNVFVPNSKRFGCLDDFFIPETQWRSMREGFFKRAGLPEKVEDVSNYLKKQLNKAYDAFLEQLPKNSYAHVDEQGWHLSVDQAEKMDTATKQKLENLQQWLAATLRGVKLPELLIEVDNELHFTRPFMAAHQPNQREAERVCTILATLIAHGCNIGPYTMARLTDGISYKQIRQVTDWQLTEEAQRQALAVLVNAISRLDVTRAWGSGKTSSSDGQRFRLRRKLLQRTYSHSFSDYALEFYVLVN